MAIFVVLWSYLLTTKLSCLQKNNFGHTNVGTCAITAFLETGWHAKSQSLSFFFQDQCYHFLSHLLWWYHRHKNSSKFCCQTNWKLEKQNQKFLDNSMYIDVPAKGVWWVSRKKLWWFIWIVLHAGMPPNVELKRNRRLDYQLSK